MTQRWTTFFAAAVLVASLACGGATEPDTKGTSSKSGSYELVPCEFADEVAKEKQSQQLTYFQAEIELAKQGDSDAQESVAVGLSSIGLHYEANSLWRCLADQGDAGAQSALGFNAQMGDGMPLDYAEAARWYRLAAEQGDPGSQQELATAYANGIGVPQDDVEAARWYRLAAEQGRNQSKVGLGRLYSAGRGVPKDDVQAHMWFNLAAAGFRVRLLQDEAVKLRDQIASRLTPDQRAEAQRLAREWDEAHPR
jgi:hypothetical protein